MTLRRRRLVRVPASSANLGPGFDVLAAALALQLEVEVQETGSFAVVTELDVPRDRSNLLVRGFERLHPADAFEFRISSEIPLSGGLGSSAAAIVAGLLAADHLFELDADVMSLAAELEGHPDNVAAAIEGGFVVCQGTRVHRFEPPMGLEAVIVVPFEGVATEAARAALPASVPLGDAVFNVAEAATLMLGLAGANLELISSGLHDRLHQPHRAHLYPRSLELVERAPALGALGATISGAGPSVLVWCHYEQTGAVMDALEREASGWARVVRAPFESQGADVREL
jgi:homoserine kinase